MWDILCEMWKEDELFRVLTLCNFVGLMLLGYVSFETRRRP